MSLPPAFDDPSLGSWLRRPEVLIGLSALLLSLCGLGISLYEASLIRQAQRASVWPYVEVGASFNGGTAFLWVRNAGVGPARVRRATIYYQGEPVADWMPLLQRLAPETDVPDYSYSLLAGRVLPAVPNQQLLFRLEAREDTAAQAVAAQLRQAVLEGALDVHVCYCSVYDECEATTLREVAAPEAAAAQVMASSACEETDTPGI